MWSQHDYFEAVVVGVINVFVVVVEVVVVIVIVVVPIAVALLINVYLNSCRLP